MSTVASMPGVSLQHLLTQLPFDFDIEAPGIDHGEGETVDQVKICGLSADSRELAEGDIFAALQGGQYHGLDYLELINNKAAALLVDQGDARAVSIETPLPVVRVSMLAERLGEIASGIYQQPSAKMKVCGITGTDGKTSVSRFIACVLQELGMRAGYIGTIGWGMAGDELADNPLTTPPPATLQAMLASLQQREAEIAVLEVSSHALQQGRASGVQFKVVALTNLGRDHLDYHETVEGYRAAKRKLFEWPDIEVAVLNLDDAFGVDLATAAKQAGVDHRVVGYSLVNDSDVTDFDEPLQQTAKLLRPEFFATDIVADTQGVAFTLHQGDKHWRVSTGLLGRFNVSNLLATVGVLDALGLAPQQVVEALPRIKSVDGRMERFHVTGQPTAVVDYSHTPQALRVALETLRQHCEGALWVVFGCGGDRDRGKRPEMGSAAVELADHIIVTDDNPRTEQSTDIIDEIVAGKESAANLKVIPDRRSAIVYAMAQAAPADWVLVAGKGHEDYQLVGTERLHFSDREVVNELLATRSVQETGS